MSSCCDEVIIVIHAHGSERGQLELNPGQTIESHRKELVTIGDTGGGEIGTEKLKELLDKISGLYIK